MLQRAGARGKHGGGEAGARSCYLTIAWFSLCDLLVGPVLNAAAVATAAWAASVQGSTNFHKLAAREDFFFVTWDMPSLLLRDFVRNLN